MKTKIGQTTTSIVVAHVLSPDENFHDMLT